MLQVCAAARRVHAPRRAAPPRIAPEQCPAKIEADVPRCSEALPGRIGKLHTRKLDGELERLDAHLSHRQRQSVRGSTLLQCIAHQARREPVSGCCIQRDRDRGARRADEELAFQCLRRVPFRPYANKLHARSYGRGRLGRELNKLKRNWNSASMPSARAARPRRNSDSTGFTAVRATPRASAAGASCLRSSRCAPPPAARHALRRLATICA